MNTVNTSTGFTVHWLHAQIHTFPLPNTPTCHSRKWHSTHRPDTLTSNTTPTSDGKETAQAVINQLADDLLEAKDSLTAAKISQAHHANKDCFPNPTFNIGNCILLTTAHHWWEYMQAKDGCIAKFMPRFNRPFKVTHAYPESSTYTLLLPKATKIHWMFHSSLLQPFMENDPLLFPSCTLGCPRPIVTTDGEIKYFIDRIIDEHTHDWGKQFLVRWLGYGPEADLWLPQCKIDDTEAYMNWLKSRH